VASPVAACCAGGESIQGHPMATERQRELRRRRKRRNERLKVRRRETAAELRKKRAKK